MAVLQQQRSLLGVTLSKTNFSAISITNEAVTQLPYFGPNEIDANLKQAELKCHMQESTKNSKSPVKNQTRKNLSRPWSMSPQLRHHQISNTPLCPLHTTSRCSVCRCSLFLLMARHGDLRSLPMRPPTPHSDDHNEQNTISTGVNPHKQEPAMSKGALKEQKGRSHSVFPVLLILFFQEEKTPIRPTE
jgi:hypothetical protein